MIYSAAHNAVIYKNDAPLKMLAITEGAQQFNGHHVAVPATLNNLQNLRKENFPVPSPLDCAGYAYPIRRPWVPLPHQKITAAFLALHKRCCCLNDMGTMKTLSALWAMDFIMRQQPGFKWLIVCPISIMKDTWGEEIFNSFLDRRSYAIVHGSPEKRLRELNRDVDFYIINPDGLCSGVSTNKRLPFTGLAAALHERTDIRGAVVDEASCYRDATTKRHRAARGLLSHLDYLWLLTGTPTSNAPTDAYGLAKLAYNSYGESFRSFKGRTMVQITQFKWVPAKGSAMMAHQILEPAIRYAIEDCAQLPPCTVVHRSVELSSAQSAAYKKLKNEAVLMLQAGTIKAVNEAALRTKLIQIACGAVYDEHHHTHRLDAEPRLSILDEIIGECSEKIIIFAPLTNVLKMLKEHLANKGLSCEIINGEVSQSARAAIFTAFRSAAEPRVLIADPGTMAHGLNLTVASTVIWYAPTDKTELYLQANKRIDRPGQTKNTLIVQIAGTSIEREIYKRLDANQSMQGLILQLVKERI